MSDFMVRFDAAYRPILGARATTFRAVVREALCRFPTSVVETGSMRKADNWEGDGQSTIIWNDLMNWQKGSFITIDISDEAAALSRENCPEATCLCADSVKTLSEWTKMVDVLYLDSYDVDMSKPHDAALHCLFEFCAIQRCLHSGSIVFIDDCPIDQFGRIGGKGLYVAQYLQQLKILPFATGYQAAWIMP